ncbi:UNVERIFIED_CONTAM: hypothetical protein FKN15_012363 [Acipenser sinensis]
MKELHSEEAFENMEDLAKEITRKCNSTTVFQKGRVCKRKIFFDELAEEEPITDNRDRFKVGTFYYVLEVFAKQF